MAAGDSVGEHEELVRALYSPLWDEALQRATTRAFTQIDASVSRTAILSYEAIVDIFKADLGDQVVATASTTVQVICEACSSDTSIFVRVVEDPVESGKNITANPAHAEIRARLATDRNKPVELSKKIARQILKLVCTRKVR